MLKKAAIARGHKARIYFANHFYYSFDNNKLQLFYRKKRCKAPDVMFIRPDIVSDIDLELCLVKHLQLMGVVLFNSALSIARAKNKIRTHQILTHLGIPVPKTIVVSNIHYLDRAIDELGHFPMIMKLATGSFGSGVSLIETRRSLRSILDLLIASNSTKNAHILLQEYVREAKGKDIRAFVIGKRVVAAMQRSAQKGEFRANLHKGGSSGVLTLTPYEEEIALRAARVLGLEVAGVDIIRTTDGPKILEVNSNPGLEGITQATGLDIADLIVQHAEEKFARRKKKGKTITVLND
ncbi:RimK family alpha-L-glutamate ligase [Candidatus Gracilibacteria bacterium]|nr:RimK family alpha-L-glutamate ligase [Candidatus Gracilibacteria bacterium]